MIINDACIAIENLVFKYGDGHEMVIEDFSCKIPLGKKVAVLGLNGSGKSTILNLLLGIFKPKKGSILLCNSSISHSLSNLNGEIGYLPQLENIPFDYSVKDYALLGRLPYIDLFSLPTEKDKQFVEDVLESLSMSDLINKKLREISGGELQRVRLARILIQDPEIILMDEPATHLDIKNKVSLYKLISHLSEQGKTIFFSSHDPIESMGYSDYCILLNKNRRTRLVKSDEPGLKALLSDYFETPIG